MARTPSTMLLGLGERAPDFSLPDAAGEAHALADVKGSQGLLVMFICNHCPFVKHIRDELARLGRDARRRGVGVVAIMSNDFEAYPDDAPAKMAEEARQAGYDFPYLVDASQAVAKAYRAACTPDFFLFDANLRLAYRGQLDSARPGNGLPVDGRDLRAAIEAMIGNQPVSPAQTPSIGCNIKWKPGNEPAYAG